MQLQQEQTKAAGEALAAQGKQIESDVNVVVENALDVTQGAADMAMQLAKHAETVKAELLQAEGEVKQAANTVMVAEQHSAAAVETANAANAAASTAAETATRAVAAAASAAETAGNAAAVAEATQAVAGVNKDSIATLTANLQQLQSTAAAAVGA